MGWVMVVPLLPWLAALWIGVGMLTGQRRGEAGERGTAWVALLAATGSLLGMLVVDGMAVHQGVMGHVVVFPWLSSGPLRVTISLLLDRPGLVMGTLVAFGALMTLKFAVNYMHREPGFHRFFAVLCLFAGGMTWIALSGNAVLTFVGWEVAGLSSYLLIAYADTRTTATTNATRAFVTNRFGDAGMVFGMAMVFLWTKGVEWPAIFQAAKPLGSLLTAVMVAGFLLAAVVKSAQIPFVAWISRALEGPTPSSAVFYGALMAHAGAFLVIRLEPLLVLAPFWMVILMLIGGLTALFASAVGRVQTDVKSVLIFSTQAQIGLIFFECGAGFFDFALWHLVAHTLWRFYQFLLSPSYIHLAPVRPSAGGVAKSPALYTLLLHRGWFDSVTDALITRPTLALARDVQIFDELVISRMSGRPMQESLLRHMVAGVEVSSLSGVTQGRGVLGRLLERVGMLFFWFEEHLVLRSSGDGLLKAMRFLGEYVTRIELLFGQPRYLYLMIMLTFLVIL
ncbi:MAG: hypothetical protein HQL94_00645 [Magnetococcales bacterium]|nr:hypothetical protein [Magnetococcales bacterium]MBF0437811.1 hypothetical protein [Magnetococcales bacterium]